MVKMVYTLYLKGYSILGIIAVLQQKGIPTPKGKEKWSKRAIEVMLANKKYVAEKSCGICSCFDRRSESDFFL